MLSSRLLRAAYTPASAVPIEPAFVHLPLTRWPRPSNTASGLTQDNDDASIASTSTSTSNQDAYVTRPSHVFHAPSRPDILHQCVVAHLASLRQGTAHTKNRAEVRGSNRKIQRQKGSGRARVGDVSSPIRRGGGRAFPKRQKDWSLGLNGKVWKMGIRTALSERWRRGELSVIPSPPSLESVSTRTLTSTLSTFPDLLSSSTSSIATPSLSASKILFLVSSLESNFAISARNLPNVTVELVDDIDVYPLLQGDRVVLDVEAVQTLSDWLGRRDQSSSSSLSSLESEESTTVASSSSSSSSAAGKGSPPETWPTEDGADVGEPFAADPEVIVEEEAETIWQRYPEDPLKREEDLAKIYEEHGIETGDAVRDELEHIQQKEQA